MTHHLISQDAPRLLAMKLPEPLEPWGNDRRYENKLSFATGMFAQQSRATREPGLPEVSNYTASKQRPEQAAYT
jgi:hypothetical protein